MLDILQDTLKFSLPVLVTIFLGLFFAGMLLELGLLRRISVFSRPLVAVAHLPEVCASSFIVSLGSTVAANSMIARFHKDDLIQPKEVFLCTMVNSIPAYIREIFTYQIPVVVPALGLVAGGLYAMVFMVTGLVKIAVVIILGRIMLGERTIAAGDPSANRKAEPFRSHSGRLSCPAGHGQNLPAYRRGLSRHDLSRFRAQREGIFRGNERSPLSRHLPHPGREHRSPHHLCGEPNPRNNHAWPNDTQRQPHRGAGHDRLDAGKHVHAAGLCPAFHGAELHGPLRAKAWLVGGLHFHGDQHTGTSGVSAGFLKDGLSEENAFILFYMLY